MSVAMVHGLLLNAEGKPARNEWVQFEARVNLAPLADKSALVVYETVSAKTDQSGVLPMTEIIGSDATGVTIPWSLIMRIGGKRREHFRFLAPVGSTVDLASVAHVPEGENEAMIWSTYALRAETAAAVAEEAIEGIGDAPSFVLIFENGLV